MIPPRDKKIGSSNPGHFNHQNTLVINRVTFRGGKNALHRPPGSRSPGRCHGDSGKIYTIVLAQVNEWKMKQIVGGKCLGANLAANLTHCVSLIRGEGLIARKSS